MDYYSLRKKWEEIYDIPIEKQLLLSQNETACRFYDTPKNNKMGDFKLRIIPTPKFVLFDKRNTIKFDENSNKAKIMDFCDEKKQRLIFLKWFDIYFQEITPIQFVMGNHENMTIERIIRYMENEFIATTSAQKVWRKNILSYFKKMENVNSNHPKLMVYREYKNSLQRLDNNGNERIPWWTICVFQLNTEHPAFNKHKFTTIEEKHSLLQ